MTTTAVAAAPATGWELSTDDGPAGSWSMWTGGHLVSPVPTTDVVHMAQAMYAQTGHPLAVVAAFVHRAEFRRGHVGTCEGRNVVVPCEADGTGSGYYDDRDEELPCFDVEPVTWADFPLALGPGRV